MTIYERLLKKTWKEKFSKEEQNLFLNAGRNLLSDDMEYQREEIKQLSTYLNEKILQMKKEYTNKKKLDNFPDKLISVIDYIIDKLSSSKDLIKLINKNLSLGLYNKDLIEIINAEYKDLKTIFIDEINKYSKKVDNPDVTLFMIIELVGSTCYNSILNNEPLPIKEFKPYLYTQVRKMIE